MKRGAPDHPKTLDLARRLKIPRWGAVGLLELLWHFTARYAPDGIVGKFQNDKIAAGVHWRGDPSRLVAALIDSGWLDPHPVHRLEVHDWWEHMDQAVQRRIARLDSRSLVGDYPETATYLRSWDASAALIDRIILGARKEYDALTDGQLVWCLTQAASDTRDQRSPGLFLTTVPELIRGQIKRWETCGIPSRGAQSAQEPNSDAVRGIGTRDRGDACG